jgi:hypothetical protein
MRLPEHDIQLSAFRLDVSMPGEALVQMEAKITDLGGDWDGRIVERSCVLVVRKCDLHGFGLVHFYSPSGVPLR